MHAYPPVTRADRPGLPLHPLRQLSGPWEIIARLPGVEYVESGQEQSCCGGGGLFGLMHYDLAQSIGMKRAGEIASSGAEDLTGGSMQAHLMEQLQEEEADLVTLQLTPDRDERWSLAGRRRPYAFPRWSLF